MYMYYVYRGSEEMKIHLFSQCLIDMFYPNVGMDAVEVLERLGCEITVPEQQVCCGQMFTNSGYDEAALPAIKNTIELFEDAPIVVSLSGSCAFAIRDEYHHILRHEPKWLARAEKLSGKIFEFTEFIVDKLGVTDVGAFFPEKVTYHKSCHVTRLLGVHEQPMKLLKGIKGLEYLPMEQADRCCGFGGTFSVKMPEISAAMTDNKAFNAAATGAKYVVGSDMACLMNIQGDLDRLFKEGKIDQKMEVMHIATLLNQR